MPRTVNSWSPWRRNPPPTLRFDLAIACSRSASDRPEREEARRIGLDVHLLQVAAEGHDVGHPRHLAQHAHDVPLHLRAQLVEIVAVARDAELVDLAERRGFGRELRRRPGRQLGGRRALQDDRARGKAC